MRSDGERMIVGMKDAVKLIGISVISFCAVFVCTLFLNYRMDLLTIEELLVTEQEKIVYDAQEATSVIVCLITGGCLLLTSAVTLCFYIKHYIDTHKKELGILKALGYGNGRIAASFWVFGSSVFAGAGLGFLAACGLMPALYRVQNKDALLPDMAVRYHFSLVLWMVLLPTALFSLLAILYARIRLRVPPLRLLKEESLSRRKERRAPGRNTKTFAGFLRELKHTTLWEKKILLFFIVFSSFCFSAMTQMSFSMKELASEMMGAMMMVIGLVLAVTTLFLAVTTVVRGNSKTIAVMRAFGYSQRSCCHALLGVYRPAAYIGFAIGTAYQYGLLRLMVDLVFRDMEGVPAYAFSVPRMLVSLACFAVLYEILMFVYSEKMRHISIKEIMMGAE
ncbi:MAG: ABC transporter permease [Clostridium sp.]|nr:ABC transporter permease [Clostridium sp.]